jgi:hypothetical protein
MGAYVNPSNESKEVFLKREGKIVSSVRWEDLPKNVLPVVLMNNGFFTAAGIAFSKRELEAFTRPDDFRLRTFFLVSIDKLLEVSNLTDYLS